MNQSMSGQSFLSRSSPLHQHIFSHPPHPSHHHHHQHPLINHQSSSGIGSSSSSASVIIHSISSTLNDSERAQLQQGIGIIGGLCQFQKEMEENWGEGRRKGRKV